MLFVADDVESTPESAMASNVEENWSLSTPTYDRMVKRSAIKQEANAGPINEFASLQNGGDSFEQEGGDPIDG